MTAYIEKKAITDDYKKSLGCLRCGSKINLLFHHPPCVDKNPKLSQGRSRTLNELSWDDLCIEIAKCEILCVTCHGVHHGKEKKERES